MGVGNTRGGSGEHTLTKRAWSHCELAIFTAHQLGAEHANRLPSTTLYYQVQVQPRRGGEVGVWAWQVAHLNQLTF